LQNEIKDIDEDSGDEKENEEMKPAEVKEPKPEKGVRTEEDIMEEYGLADYDNEQVNKPSPVFQT
jgi:hypothetical protein